MTTSPLRILVVEDDFLTARRLACEIRANGDHVVGPFATVHDALPRAGMVQAAILDVRVQDETSFAIADSLARDDIPFVFLTGYDPCVIPPRFAGRRVYAKPSSAAPLLENLHRQHAKTAPRPATARHDSIETVVVAMMQEARRLMPDEASVERLVEAVLLRAIAEQAGGPAPADLRGWLFGLLDAEHRDRGRTHLQ